ncbi:MULTISPECIES: nuclear transport factor 2 family protein [Shewanella]|uniref:nuclear transport factor 2 family protein n=1 Tax=Shewanella TaxID=22 RepID=UPI001C6568CB|nr:nuclear transport factor 2 family protein [Shewanella zhangzhouensis]QYK03431.1 hypothetical protein K0H63_09825 [Shewanella zhangzhouensis]
MDNCIAIVQRQLDFYNRKDIAGWLSTYAKDARQFNLHGEQIACGHEEMRQRIAIRFAEPDLHAHLLSRIVMNNIVVDHELITRNFPEGKGQVEMLCVYEIKQGVISTASFSVGKAELFAAELAKG